MSTTHAPDQPARDAAPTRSRRVLLGGGLAVMATGAGLATPGRADAAGAGDPWVCGGNTGITTDGTNYLGTQNVAPLILKTAATDGSPLERLRITPAGKVGIGTTTPSAQLTVRTTNGLALRGQATGAFATNVGIQGLAANGTAVDGVATGPAVGVRATSANSPAVQATSSNSTGVRATGGIGVEANGGQFGVIGKGSLSGVRGQGYTYGLEGQGGTGTGSGTRIGVYGNAPDYGVIGQVSSGTAGADPVGVYGTSPGVGVRGEGSTGVEAVSTTGIGVVGTGLGFGVLAQLGSGTPSGSFQQIALVASSGQAQSSNALAGKFFGSVAVTGTISKAGGTFKIDHPLDPDRKWLSHSFVESPDRMNVYNGNVVLDAGGAATVDLPDYFGALNRDFRYQLTPIGGAAPDLHVATEVSDGSFRIAGGKPGLTVSWQVTGIRQDDWARAHPMVVEQDKVGADKGKRQFVAPGSGATLIEAPTAP